MFSFSPNVYIAIGVGAIMQRLDNLRLISKIDSSKMLGLVDRFPDHLLGIEGYALKKVPRVASHPENLVLMGMGGSASAADVLLDWLRNRIRIPAKRNSMESHASSLSVATGTRLLAVRGLARTDVRVHRGARGDLGGRKRRFISARRCRGRHVLGEWVCRR